VQLLLPYDMNSMGAKFREIGALYKEKYWEGGIFYDVSIPFALAESMKEYYI
jgi:hypothetical protein